VLLQVLSSELYEGVWARSYPRKRRHGIDCNSDGHHCGTPDRTLLPLGLGSDLSSPPEPFHESGSRRMVTDSRKPIAEAAPAEPLGISLREQPRPPLWAVHFSDRLAFSPVGLFCDRCIAPKPRLTSIGCSAAARGLGMRATTTSACPRSALGSSHRRPDVPTSQQSLSGPTHTH